MKNTQPPPLGLSIWPPCIHMMPPTAMISAENDPTSGQMLGGRMW
jgi:hypothetical protein